MKKRWTRNVLGFVGAVATAVVSGYIVTRLSGTPLAQILAYLWVPFGAAYNWFAAPARLTHWDVTFIIVGLFALGWLLVRRLRRLHELAMGNISNHEMRLGRIEHPETRPEFGSESGSQTDEQPPASDKRKSPSKFEPDKFELTGPRARALLGLLQRVDARTTLDDLYRFVAPANAPYVDMETTKARVQSDMEEAERLGIVGIERISTLTQCYSLTTPDGRDWVLRNQVRLLAEARKVMIRRDLRSP